MLANDIASSFLVLISKYKEKIIYIQSKVSQSKAKCQQNIPVHYRMAKMTNLCISTP